MEVELGSFIVVMIGNLLTALLALAVDVGASEEYITLLTQLADIYIAAAQDQIILAAYHKPEAVELLGELSEYVSEAASK